MITMRKFLTTALLLAVTAAPVWAQDIIKFKDPNKNPDMEGEIATMTYKLVEIDINVGGTLARQPADARQVLDLVPSNSKKSFDFAKGEESMANNDFDTAIERFERTKKDARASELQKQLSSINIVRCQYYKGNPNGVVQAAQALRAQKADSFYVRESFELEFKAQVALRANAGATAVANAFAAMGNANGMQESAKSAELMQAALAELQQHLRARLACLQGAMVLSKGEAGPEHEASLGRAAVACAKIATNEKDKAKKDIYRGRAQEMLGELTQIYTKGSKYVPEADKAIKEIK